MERISSRQNRTIAHFRRLSGDADYRRERGEFVCDGEKLLGEALAVGAEITAVLWREGTPGAPVPGASEYLLTRELLDYVSPLKNSPGPVFSVRICPRAGKEKSSAIVLEGVQDPGNVGTVIRTAAALGIGRVLLCPGCADIYNPKTVRATMGAVFRQSVSEIGLSELRSLDVPLYGAVLSERAEDISALRLSERPCAVAVGSEGRGLSRELVAICDGELIIPMAPGSESLNAAVAAGIIMWEMCPKV